MHFARLVKQASVDSVSQPICLFGAYIEYECNVLNVTHVGDVHYKFNMLTVTHVRDVGDSVKYLQCSLLNKK